ncbi:Lsr2 family protein [Nonomuraea sp. NPDC050328]|uniref:Lsr2 family protein n=1 Tax=Nonomuraea sp. NPDC050328 TaxID=3364361 RepID=UPI00379E98CE
MAKQVITKYVDDLDGSEAEGTVRFSIGNDAYEIDLSSRNEDSLRKALAPYIAAARPVRDGRSVRGRKLSVAGRDKLSRDESSAIRSWAKEAGLNVSERGRISKMVVDAYEAARA